MLKKKIYINKTINRQLILRCIILVVITLSISWISNAFFLDYYYIRNKTEKLLLLYEELNSFDYNKCLSDSLEPNKNELDEFDEFVDRIGILCRRHNLNFIITDDSSNTVLTSINEPKQFNKFLRDIIFERESEIIKKTILENDNYTICNMTDPTDHMEYTVMWGNLDNGDFFMVRTALAGIRDDVKISNLFLFFVSIGAITFGCIALSFVSTRITKPIRELTVLSKRMADLDFEAKYSGKSNNEIDVLGENFNHMSETLEDTIGRLKTANEELQKDVENKTRIDNMRKEFLSNVSHELKTPIALIQGYAEGLKEGITDDPENMEFYCDVIIDETAKMNKMVKQLMALNQLEFGAENLEMARFNISELVENFVQANSILAKEKDINVKFENNAGNVFVWSDEYRIEEVLRNYFNNAINHINDNKLIKITVNANEDTVRVGVFNTGSAIPEEAIPNLWDKFYKVDKARTREYGGSGIGLSIVKATMDNLHGHYGVINKSNGVEFWFDLRRD